ncbi:MAG: hypothetical protein KBT12_02745 [Bacteroidales bacterium]|nr:hypothetical protein [Candidatus Physcousia equi]
MQVFSETDRILIELIATNETIAPPVLKLTHVESDYTTNYSWRVWTMNKSTKVYFIILQGLDESTYIASIGGRECEPFYVTSDESVLQDTVLIQYSNRDNRQRNDSVFWIDGMQHFFDFRIPGGFKDDNWSFNVNSEQFTTADNDRIDLYGQETTIKALTIGNSCGCPVWFADLVNRLLCCNYVYVEGVRYCRNESDVPEMNAEVEGNKSYIFKQSLLRVMNLDPTIEQDNHIIMRRVENDKYRANTIDSKTFNLIV